VLPKLDLKIHESKILLTWINACILVWHSQQVRELPIKKKKNQNVILKVRMMSKQVLEGEYECENP